MKMLIDMNLSPRWVAWLETFKVSAAHWSSLGSAAAPDTEIAAYAAKNDFVILTNDLDFGAILAATQGTKPSVIQLRSENLNQEHAGEIVKSAIVGLAAELESGVLVTVDVDRVRIALLPLRLTR
jgi:predicted nuclease of predicted toxin-antitoxin system